MNINDVLRNLNASTNGEYYILSCPHCGKKEAYCYIEDIKKWESNKDFKIIIRCNRQNKCGQISYLNDYLTDVKLDKPLVIKESNPVQMSYEGVKLLQQFGKYIVGSLKCNTEGFDFDIRGISNQTLKNNGIIYYKKSFEDLINQEKTKKHFGNKYRFHSYENRDILIPIMNEEGIPERYLLRSLNPQEDEKKEIQLMLIKKGLEIWNTKDILDNDVIFVTEGVYDALSIKDVCQETGVIALPGVNKYKQLIRFIKKHPGTENKTFIFALDNDEAGAKFMKQLVADFNELKIRNTIMSFYKYKDCNEFLLNDREAFKRKVCMIYNRYKRVSE